MAKPRIRIATRKTDYNRVLVTETQPYETPIIFSNEGLYLRSKEYHLQTLDTVSKTIFSKIVVGTLEKRSHTIPYFYKIRKNTSETRRLALIHPFSQEKFCSFYRQYEMLIVYYCTRSPISLRAPCKVAGSFYTSGSEDRVFEYKDGKVSTPRTDPIAKHTPSFYSYRGFERLYKFYGSRMFFDLEKRFPVMKTLDVSKCFDSIYTHSLSWAVKDKIFTKKHVNIASTFPQAFDALMRLANYNETNGIIVGPEISRIFAEILLQEIDLLSMKRALSLGLRYDIDYVARRYVDDVFIFALDQETAETVYSCYSDILGKFNLSTNSSKSTLLQRPFVTQKSRAILAVRTSTNALLERLSQQAITESVVINEWRMVREYIDTIKTVCVQNDVEYDAISAFVIATITSKVRDWSSQKEGPLSMSPRASASVIRVIVEITFFLFQVAPSVSASYRVCIMLIILIRLVGSRRSEHKHSLYGRIYELIASFLTVSSPETHAKPSLTHEGFISLEKINLALVSKELGKGYLLPDTIVKATFFTSQDSYFSLISCLYYVGSDERYDDIKTNLMERIEKRLGDLSDVQESSEKAHLFLDLLACPYVDNSRKKAWIQKARKDFNTPAFTLSEIEKFLSVAINSYWFVDWRGVDLLNVLEKKELKQAY